MSDYVRTEGNSFFFKNVLRVRLCAATFFKFLVQWPAKNRLRNYAPGYAPQCFLNELGRYVGLNGSLDYLVLDTLGNGLD